MRRKKKMDFMKPETVYNLQNIRDELIKLEDTIIFKFIERSHFLTCPEVYKPNNPKLPLKDFPGSFLDWALLHLEITHSKIRRYESPDQTPFFPGQLAKPILPSITYPQLLDPLASEVNYNDKIKEIYASKIVPLISKGDGDDPLNYGSVVTADIDCLQSLSKRIHFGKFVAEAKFRANEKLYTELIRKRDIQGLIDSITNTEVEEKILARLTRKAEVYGVDPMGDNSQRKITPEYLVRIYKNVVIPITKEVEVEYLLRRLG